MRTFFGLSQSIHHPALRGCLSAAAFATAAGFGTAAQAQVVSQPHATAELVSEMDSLPAQGPWRVAVRIETEPGWHIYWKNSGDAGSPTRIRWQLPPGVEAGPILWPYPERFPSPPLAVYGYQGAVLLASELQGPADRSPGQTVTVGAKVSWVVCKEICLLGKADLTRQLPVGSAGGTPAARWTEAFADARRRLPRERHEWTLAATRTAAGFSLRVTPPAGWHRPLDSLQFFPDSNVVVNHAAPQPITTVAKGVVLGLTRSSYATTPAARLRGVLVNRAGWDPDGSLHALAVDVPVADSTAAIATPPPVARQTTPRHTTPAAPVADTAAKQVAAVAATKAAPATTADTAVAMTATTGTEATLPASPASDEPGLLLVLVFAALGGLLLNAMPCVFPVISLKVLSFVHLGGPRRGGAVRHGVAFAAGVLLSFWVLAGLLLLLRGAGAELGWGFQLQSPPFVAAMALLLFLLALSLLGVFDLGLPLTRLGGSAAAAPGLAGSFGTGVLATVVATPCTAPFMGPAIGVALTHSAGYALLVFTALGIGMAFPYVALAASPGLLDRLPRPGRWMVTVKQAMAFPMFATVAWLVWVLGLQVGADGVFRLLLAFTLAGVGAWLLGHWTTSLASPAERRGARGLAVAALAGAVGLGLRHQQPTAPTAVEPRPSAESARSARLEPAAIAWEPFSPERVEALRRAGRPVFIDFTAAWCLSCKVNERVALADAGVRRRLQDLDVATLRADWTSSDPVIARALAGFGRRGVPLYVLYAPHRSDPVILPTLLTPATVLDALTQVLAAQASACRTITHPNPQGGERRCNLSPLSRS